MTNLYVSKLPATWVISSQQETEYSLATPENVPQSCLELSNRILSIQGTNICLYHHEEGTNDFFTKNGQLYNLQVKRKRMEARNCHENSTLLHLDKPEYYKLITGFCLNNGMWRRHSWLVDSSNRIIETTMNRELYFGVELKKDMWERLYFLSNFLGDEYLRSMPPEKYYSLVDLEVLMEINKKSNRIEELENKLQQDIIEREKKNEK